MTKPLQSDPESVAFEPRRLRVAALEVPTFRWYWVASWISSTGDGMENVIRNVLVVQLTGADAALWLGIMIFGHWVPFTIFSLFGGVLADRYDNRKVQIVAQLLLMSAATGVAVTTLTGVVTTWWIFGFLLLHGFAGAIGGPAQQTLIHAIVGRERLLSAVSLNSSARNLSQIVGPAVAGVIVVAFGPGWGFFVNALTFLPLLLVLFAIRVKPLAERSRAPIAVALRDGLHFVASRPFIAGLIAAQVLNVILLGQAFNSFLVLFAYDVLRVDALGYAFLLVASGVGAVVATAYLATSRRQYSGRFIVGATIVEMLAVAIFTTSSSYPLSLALMAAVGAATVLSTSLTNTTIQVAAPNELRGRVMGAYTFATQGMRVVNGPILGGLALVLGAPLAVGGAAVAVVAGLLAIVARVPALRERAN